MFTTSESTGEISKAMALVQAEIGNVAVDASNPAFKRGNKDSKYATLAAVLDVCRPALSKHGIAVLQSPGNDGDQVTVTTRLTHGSGEWMQSTVGVKPDRATAQGLGAATTYLRRFALAAMCGVAQDDDDGNEASGTNGNAPSRPAGVQSGSQIRPQASAPQKGNPVDSAKADVRRWIAAMGVDREEAELLVHLDNLTPDDFRPEYRRIKDAFDAFTANGK